MDFDALEHDGVYGHADIGNYGHGLYGLGAGETVAAPSSWLTNLSSAVKDIASAAAAVKIAKTGQVPQAQINVGPTAEMKKMLIYGGIAAIGAFALYSMFGKRGRR